MNPLHRSFLRRLFLITLVIILAGFLSFGFFLQKYYTPALPLLLLFVVLFTWITYTWLVKSSGKDIGKFTRATMIITMIRFVIFGILALVWLLIFKQNGLTFVISLGILYLIYTALEISEVTKILLKKAHKD